MESLSASYLGGRLSTLITFRLIMLKACRTTLISILLGLGSLAHAETITVSNAANTAVAERQGLASQGTLIASRLVKDKTSSKEELVFTVSGLKLDQRGGKNDSVELRFSVDGHGGQIYTSPPNRDGWFSASGIFLNKSGSKISLTFESMKVLMNGGKSEGVGRFTGFSSVRLSGWGPTRGKDGQILKSKKNTSKPITDKALLNGEVIDYADHKEQRFELDNVQSITLERLDGSMRIAEYDFSFIAGASPDGVVSSNAGGSKKNKRAQGQASVNGAETPHVILGIGEISVFMKESE